MGLPDEGPAFAFDFAVAVVVAFDFAVKSSSS
jgi:hypothetical protein